MAAPSYQSLVSSTNQQKKIKVLLDARKWQDGGIGTYIRSLIRAALSRCDLKLSVIVRPQDVFSFTAEFDRDLKLIDLELSNAQGYSFKEYFLLPQKIDWSKYDLFHSPHYTLPYGIPVPVVVTVHDLIHITHPEKAFYPIVAKKLIGSALKRADHILSVSTASANDIKNFFPKSDFNKRLSVLPNALDYDFVNQACNADLPLSNLVAGDYLLCVVSGFKPHKGILDLLHVFQSLKKDLRQNKIVNGLARKIQSTKLVLVGSGSAEMLANHEAMNIIAELDNVQVLGKVSRPDLLKLYAHASAVIVPSTAEGFGLPVLEAHAFGKPVIMRPVKALLEQGLATDFVAADLSEDALLGALVNFFKVKNDNVIDFSYQLEAAKRQALTYSIEQMGLLLERSYQQILRPRV